METAVGQTGTGCTTLLITNLPSKYRLMVEILAGFSYSAYILVPISVSAIVRSCDVRSIT